MASNEGGAGEQAPSVFHELGMHHQALKGEIRVDEECGQERRPPGARPAPRQPAGDQRVEDGDRQHHREMIRHGIEKLASDPGEKEQIDSFVEYRMLPRQCSIRPADGWIVAEPPPRAADFRHAAELVRGECRVAHVGDARQSDVLVAG